MKSKLLQQQENYEVPYVTATSQNLNYYNNKAIKSQLLQHDKFMKSQLLQRQLKSNKIPTIKTTTKP